LQAGNFIPMSTAYPEPLDDDGNLWIHADGAFAGAPFMMRDAGRVIDLSQSALFLEITAAGVRKAFAVHPSDSKARWLPALTQAECAPIADGAAYVIWDETGGGRIDLFGAKVRRYQ
jgi:hypothetical protein